MVIIIGHYWSLLIIIGHYYWLSSSVPSTKQHLEILFNLLSSSLLLIAHKTWYVFVCIKNTRNLLFQTHQTSACRDEGSKVAFVVSSRCLCPSVHVRVVPGQVDQGDRDNRDHARLDDSNMKLSLLFNSLPTLVELLRVVDSSTCEHFATNPGCY